MIVAEAFQIDDTVDDDDVSVYENEIVSVSSDSKSVDSVTVLFESQLAIGSNHEMQVVDCSDMVLYGSKEF